jgi:coenzyme F420-reducing hydrogenase gamma subunit
MVKNMKKLKIAFFGHTSCKGCFFEFLILGERILDMLKSTEITNFEMIKEYNEEGPFDITFMDGAISSEKEAKFLKKIRKKTKHLIALGSCACYGGIPSMSNFFRHPEKMVYPDPIDHRSIEVKPIDEYVKVDYYLRGCPMDKEELLRVVKDIVNGKIPREKDYCVCVECKLRENKCLLEEGIPCLGPITYAGCGAPCPTIRASCDGCRGPLPDGNIKEMIKLLKKTGLKKADIKRMFKKYAPTNKKFKNVKI